MIRENLEGAKDQEEIQERAYQWKAAFLKLQEFIEHHEELELDFRDLFA
jgi:hypothetical protein